VNPRHPLTSRLASVTAACTAAVVALTFGAVPASAHDGERGQGRGGYQQVDLVSNVPDRAALTDANVSNPWGIAFGKAPNPTPLWVANNNTSTSTLYTGATSTTPGITKVNLTVATPPAPTGIVINNDANAFKLPNGTSSRFIFDSLSGEIAGWSPGATATTTMVTETGAVFTGLATAQTQKGPLLYAADAAGGVVRVYDGAFAPVRTFTDKRVPAGLTPYNVAVIGRRVYVSFFALPEEPPAAAKAPNPVTGAVSVFSLRGKLKKRLITGGRLDAPWGMAVAPEHWGRFSNRLLVGNVDDGKINAYGLHSGKFRGTVATPKGKPLVNDGLWGLAFGNGVIGTPRTLIISAGINGYADGLIAAITPVKGHHGG
jgi:uncharacterized protein (TIGR03118 family)